MKIENLHIGLLVKTNVGYSGVPVGTIGKIVREKNSWPESESVAVRWKRRPDDTLTDWFAYDELETLDVLEGSMHEKFTIDYHWKQYLKLVGLSEATMSPIQLTETRRAFYGAFVQLLIFLRDDVADLSEDETIAMLKRFVAQGVEFWERETHRQN
jgi:hypothetical protein